MLDKPFYIKRLQHEINVRKELNPRYSLRAFARYLGLGPSTLSRILLNQQELSQAVCKNILTKLKFNHEETMLFISSVAEEKKRRAYEELSNVIEDNNSKVFASYDWLIANTPDLMFVLDKKGRCIHANEAVSQFFKIPEELVIGKTIEELGVRAEMADKILPCLKSVFEKPRTVKVEECYEDKGSSRCFEITLVPVGHTEDINAVACHWRDITEKTAYENVWNHSLQIGEFLNKSENFEIALEKIAYYLTEKFCTAAILQFLETGRVVTYGDKHLTKKFLERELEKRTLVHENHILSVTLHDSTIVAIATFIRSEKRENFSQKEYELIRDLQSRSHSYLQ